MTAIYLLFGLLLLTTFWLNHASGAGKLAITNDATPKLLARNPKATGNRGCPCCICAGCSGNTGGPDIMYMVRVTLTGFSDGTSGHALNCSTCTGLNGTFDLDCIATVSSNHCKWRIDPWGAAPGGGGISGACALDTLEVSILDVGGDKHVNVRLSDDDGSGGGMQFNQDMGSGDLNCCAFSTTTVTYTASGETSGSKNSCDWDSAGGGVPTCTVTAFCCPAP